MPALTTEQAAARARKSWENTTDRTARTEPGRVAYIRKLEKEVDPHGLLTPEALVEAVAARRRAIGVEAGRRGVERRRARLAKAHQTRTEIRTDHAA